MRRAPGGRRRRPHLDPAAALAPGAVARRVLLRPGDAEGVDPAVRMVAAAEDPIPPGAPPAHLDVLEQLATAPVTAAGRIPYSSNAVFVVELDAPGREGEPLRAIYKPARGERPLWDFPHHTLALREVATYELDVALGFGLVPPTVLRDGPVGPGSMQQFVEVGPHRLGPDARAGLEPQLFSMAALDVLANNADRKSAHLVVTTEGRLIGIDHGLTFLPYPRQRTVLIELGGTLLPDEVTEAVVNLHADAERRTAVLDRLRRLLSPVEVDAFAARLRELAADPVYPELDPWDGRPFEWW